MTVRQLVEQKGRNVWTIDPDATVFDALAKMAEKDVGFLVCDGRRRIDRHRHGETPLAECHSQR
jgi:CBS domain-containing protein